MRQNVTVERIHKGVSPTSISTTTTSALTIWLLAISRLSSESLISMELNALETLSDRRY